MDSFLFSLGRGRSVIVRWRRGYAKGRKQTDRNRRYQILSYIVFTFQLLLIPAMFEFPHPWFLFFHHSILISWIGMGLCYLGLVVSILSLMALGKNYSPCFDSHEPHALIQTGVYRYLRHPGWLAKICAGVGGILVCGSLWFLTVLIWLFIEMRRTIRVEEEQLIKTFPEYEEYRRQTSALIPRVFV